MKSLLHALKTRLSGANADAWRAASFLTSAMLLPASVFIGALLLPATVPGTVPLESAAPTDPAPRDGPATSAVHDQTSWTPTFSNPACGACHATDGGFVRRSDHFLNGRASLDRASWADSVRLEDKCGACHVTPLPQDLPTGRWGDALINFMSKVMYYRRHAPGFHAAPGGQAYPEWMNRTRDEWMDVLHYYLTFSTVENRLPPDPPRSAPPLHPALVGHAPATGVLPQIANVNVVDLDEDGRSDILVCDFQRHTVSVILREGEGWTEYELAEIPYPGRTAVGDFDGDGHVDVVVANVGSNVPTDDLVGSVVLLTGRGGLQFEPVTLLDGVGRVADVRAGDFDGDGDTDFVVAVFGFVEEGSIGWLERLPDGTYRYQRLSDKVGGVHVPPVDLNDDGRLDFIALISQQHEEVAAFVNQGDGRFEEHTLFKADSPTFGSSGIELVDLDQDGDVDILYTNGDAFDLSTPMVRPDHGVQWLENLGGYRFAFHDLIRFYGAYRAVPVDLDGDGDLDVVATSMINDWKDPGRMSILWLENDGSESFIPHGIANAPTSIITAAVGDLDDDNRPDVVTGSMHILESDPRRGRVTLWENASRRD